MSYYRHYDLDTRIGLMIGEWMYRKRNGSTDVGGQPPVEPPHGAGGDADLNSFPPGAIFKPFNLAAGFSISFVTGVVFVAAAVFLFVEF